MESADACSLLGKVAHLGNIEMDAMKTQMQSTVKGLHAVALAIDHAGAAIFSGLCK